MSKLELILAIALGISEVLALIPSLKSNSVLQLVLEALRKLKSDKPKE
ncbi:MAG TPA: hypothetical protein VIS27_09560 [Yeosuana sp.]